MLLRGHTCKKNFAGKASDYGAIKQAIKTAALNVGKIKAAESLEEGVQQFTQNVIGEIAKHITGNNANFDAYTLLEGVADSFTQTLWSAIGTGSPSIRFGLDAVEARGIARLDAILEAGQKREQEILTELDGFSQNSTLAKRDPLLFQDAMHHLAQGAKIKTVYIPAEGLYLAYGENKEGLHSALEALGVEKDAFYEAMNAGNDLQISVEKYASAVATDQTFSGLVADNRRLTEDGFTINEYREFTAQRQEEVERLLADTQTEQEAATQLETESREIFETTRDMLVTVGRPLQEARSDAALTAAFFATMAQRSNGKSTPRQLWEKYAPNILGPNMGALAHLNAGIEKDLQELGGFSDVQETPSPPVVEQPPARETPSPSTQGQTSGVSSKPADEVVTHTGVQSIDDLYALAAQTLPDFQSNISNIAQATGGMPVFRSGDGLKRRNRAQEKIDRDYPEIGAKRVLDVLGGTILYGSRTDVENALPEIERLVKEAGGEVVRKKNRFDHPSAGYKDYLLNIRQPNGMVTELLLTTKAMHQAKSEGPGHVLYEAQQIVAEFFKSGQAQGEERNAAKILAVILDGISESYYETTGDQSNKTASFSGIVEPLNNASPYIESLASSKIYGRLESLLGSIRNKVPSVANTNGLSSYSKNFLTNTGSLAEPFSHGVPSDASLPSMNNVRMGGENAITEPPSDGVNITPSEAQSNSNSGRITGSPTRILGKGIKDAARYEVRELADVVPSHDAENGFAKRKDYPANVQERPYHSDKGEQEKVRTNALEYDPAYVVNTDSTAGNGPPIITNGGVVLGGNSRTMTLQLVYADKKPDRANAYRAALQGQAEIFGLDPDAIASMRQPVLVRVVDAELTPEEMAIKSRRYNQTTTQRLQAKAEGVSRAKMIKPDTLGILSAGMADFDTLRQFLDKPASRGFVDSMIRDGVIEQTEISRYTEKNGLLNDEGKKLVENALRGLIVPDYDILAAVPPSVLNKLDRAIPALARLKTRGEGWDLSNVVAAALRMVGKAALERRRVDNWFGQTDLLETDPDKKRPTVQAIAITFANATQKEALARFEVMATEAERQSKGQGMLVSMRGNTPAQAFVKAFLSPVVSVDGQTITDFDPQGNEQHAALQYAHDNGGKGHSVSAAVEKLHKTVTGKKATAEQKARAKEMIRRLAPFSGAVAVYKPDLGRYFNYRDGDTLYQPAYHGSPYRFDKFTLDHIGSGEGAQAFGWGLYFAGKKDLAEWYRTSLSGKKETPYASRYPYATQSEKKAFTRNAKKLPKELQADVADVLRRMGEIEMWKVTEDVDEYYDQKIAQALRAATAKRYDGGQLYEAEIPDNDVLLDYDKPLREQPEKVREAIDYEELEKPLIKFYENLHRRTATLENEPVNFDTITGKDLYDYLQERFQKARNPAEAASRFLNGMGIPGLRYLDGNSRAQGEGSHNFVIWDDAAIDVLNTYYQPETDGQGQRDPQYAEQQAKFDAAPVAMVTGEEIFTPTEKLPALKSIRAKLVQWLKDRGWLKEYTNTDTGWNINVSGQSIKDTIYHGAGLGKVQVVAALPEMLQNGIYLEPGKLAPNGNQRHIFAAKVRIGEDTFVIGYVVEEHKDGKRFYNHELTEIESLGSPARSQGEGKPGHTEASVLDIVRKYLGVKPDVVLNSGVRGSITLNTPSGRPLIELFRDADASTFLHESGHLYLEILRAVGTDRDAPPEIAALWGMAKAALNMRDDHLTREHHEAWASSLEGYLMRGESPRRELQTLFDRFSGWLKAIYNGFRSLGVQPNEELYAVFDRIFATDAQIADAEAWHDAQKPLAGLLEQMSEEERQAYQKAREDARETAKSDRLTRLTKAYVQAIGGRKRLADEAWAETNALPVYAAMDVAGTTGVDLDEVDAIIGEDARKQLGKKRVGLVRNEGGELPDILAAQHGYDSAEAMLNDMLNAESKAARVKRLVAEREQQIADTLARGLEAKNALPGDAEYHNDDRLAILIAEQQILQRGAGMQVRSQARALEVAAARQVAREAVAKTLVRDLQPHKHALAERRAGKKAAAAAAKGDMALAVATQEATDEDSNLLREITSPRTAVAIRKPEGQANGYRKAAAEYKRQEMLSHALYMESREARDAVEKGVKSMGNATKQKALQPGTRDLLHDIAVAKGIVKYGNQPDPGAGFRQYLFDLKRDGKTRPDAQAWLSRVGEAGYAVYLGDDDAALRLQTQTFYRDMDFTEFTALRDAFRQIQHVDREERTVIQDGKRREVEEIRNELVAAAEANDTEVKRNFFERNRPWNKIKTAIAKTNATLKKMEMALLKLDGYEHGVWWNTIFRPIADAESARNVILKAAEKKLKGLTDALFTGAKGSYDFFNKRIRIDAINESLTMSQIVSMALNVGNAVNRERLLTGHGWRQKQLDAVLEQMEERHWDFAQGIWDFLETFKDPSFNLQKDLTGAEPQAVEAETVHTKFGDYRGGYYPIVYDKDTGFKAWERAMKDMGDAIFGGTSYGTMQTRQGHLKARQDGGTGERLSDDLGVIVNHVFNTVHDVTHRRAIINVAKLLKDKGIGEALDKYLGPELRKEFLPWLQNIARETNEQYVWANTLMRKGRNAVTLFYLGWRLTSMLMQIADLPVALAQKGEGRNTAKGLALMYGNPLKTPERVRFIMRKSPFMANRLKDMDREFREAISGMRLVEGKLAKIKKTSMKGIGVVQLGIDMPIWMGAYEAELAKSGDEARAVAVADSTVRLTTGSGSAKDLVSLQRGAEWKKLITMFYTPFSAHYNLYARRVNQTKKWTDVPGLASYSFILWVVAPALANWLTGRGPDEDEGEEWPSWLLNIALREPFSMIPIARDIASSVGTGFAYEPTPAAKAVKNAVRFGEAVYKGITEDEWEGIGTKTAEFAGIATGGVITSQQIITIGNVWDYMNGDAYDFQLRDLFFKKQKSRR
jgi:hypothetical protein